MEVILEKATYFNKIDYQRLSRLTRNNKKIKASYR